MKRHLNENELAQFVDWVIGDYVEIPPDLVREHVEECFECQFFNFGDG